jgi:hypothetical protein
MYKIEVILPSCDVIDFFLWLDEHAPSWDFYLGGGKRRSYAEHCAMFFMAVKYSYRNSADAHTKGTIVVLNKAEAAHLKLAWEGVIEEIHE